MKFKEHDQFIGVYKNSVPVEHCSKIENFYNRCVDHGIVKHSMDEASVHILSRDDNVVKIPSFMDETCTPEGWSGFYWQLLDSCLDKYRKEWPIDQVLVTNGYKLHKVEEGEGYHAWHSEWGMIVSNRCLAYMTYLSAPKEGGETEFLFQKRRIKPEVGTTLIWPAYFTHPHRGNPVLKGSKLYITGWYNASL